MARAAQSGRPRTKRMPPAKENKEATFVKDPKKWQ